MRPGRLSLGVAVLGVLLTWGCIAAREIAGILGDLQSVQKEVVKATGHQAVTVNLLNNRYLSVGMVNSPWHALPEDDRRMPSPFQHQS